MSHRRTTFALLLSSLILLPAGCTKRPRNTTNGQQPIRHATIQTNSVRININTASAHELETLPGIGKTFAQKIIEHREKYGPFRKPEHLIIVRGISEKRFQNLRDFITVE